MRQIFEKDKKREAFKTAACLATEHAAAISSALFTVGNTWLFTKAGLRPDFDTAAGLAFLAAGFSLLFVKKYPVAAFRVAGGTTVLAAFCMSAKGLDFDHGHVIDGWRVASPLFGFGISGTLLGLQNGIGTLANTWTLRTS